MNTPALIPAAILLGLSGLCAKEEAAPEEMIEISLTSFNDIIFDAVKIAERLATKDGDLERLTAQQLDELSLKLTTHVFQLWMDALSALAASAGPDLAAPEVFPPGFAEVLRKTNETEVPAKHVIEMVRELKEFAEKVAKTAPAANGAAARIKMPRKWVDDFLVERQAIAMRAMEQSELGGPRVPVQNRGAQGVFVELGGMRIFRRISTADVPEVGPVYCAPFGKGGTWNLYQVFNKPVTWLQANDTAEKMVAPLDVGKPGFTGHLVSLLSPEENAFVVSIAKNIAYFWIGLNDRRLEAGNDPEGPWEWSSGEPVTWRNWYEHEPDSGGILNPLETFDNRTDEDGVVCAGTLEPAVVGKWKDNATGTCYGKNHRACYVVEWNVNAPEPIPGAQRLEAATPQPK
jgi:hypothetical protein